MTNSGASARETKLHDVQREKLRLYRYTALSIKHFITLNKYEI